MSQQKINLALSAKENVYNLLKFNKLIDTDKFSSFNIVSPITIMQTMLPVTDNRWPNRQKVKINIQYVDSKNVYQIKEFIYNRLNIGTIEKTIGILPIPIGLTLDTTKQLLSKYVVISELELTQDIIDDNDKLGYLLIPVKKDSLLYFGTLKVKTLSDKEDIILNGFSSLQALVTKEDLTLDGYSTKYLISSKLNGFSILDGEAPPPR